MYLFIPILIFAACACIAIGSYLRFKTVKQIKLNTEIQNQNIEAEKSLAQTEQLLKQARTEHAGILADTITAQDALVKLQESAQSQADEFARVAMAQAQERIALNTERLQQVFQSAKVEYTEEYTSVLKDLAAQYATEMDKIENAINMSQLQLHGLQEQVKAEESIVRSAVEARKRAAEMEQKIDFYKLELSDADKAEIKTLRECLVSFRNPEPLNKVIWKVYYEKPTTDLIGRVIGTGVHCGIYKITNIENNMCYVGQSVNLADRWKQHIKRGIGADTPTRNKLYPAMLAIGVENFTFEVVEECAAAELSNREKFWTDYFKAQEFGYSIRKG